MRGRYKIMLIFFLMCFGKIYAQLPAWDNPNQRTETILVEPVVQLEARMILPEKLTVKDSLGHLVSSEFYSVDYTSGEIRFDPSLQGDTLEITYFIHPDLQEASLFTKDTALIIEPTEENLFYTLSRENREAKKPFDGLNSRGSLVRGIRFGNNQSASVQSSLDLQLTGMLTDEIGINAVIADNNLPMQADGYTQQLKEFDKVYVELFNKNSKVRAGQIDLVQEKDYFGNFYEKVTGLQVSTEITHADDSKTRVSVAGSTSRGEFAKKEIKGQNGNQGPYRLQGNNNELYIIIVSGSERIYLDGVLMERGEDRDYVINYNTGELTFTSNRMITDNSRITAEYLYTNRVYQQVLLYGDVEHESERFRIAGHFYSNGDAKNNPLNDDLSDEDKRILSEAGNDTDLMYNTTALPAEWDPDRVLYRKITVDGVEIFEYSTDPEEVLYSVTFTRLGENQGNYRQVDLNINGKVFEYVPPLNGIKQGTHEPLRRLVPPKRLQVYTLNSSYKLKKGGLLGIDLGMSSLDKNLFSSKDDEDNLGFAGRIYGNREFKMGSWLLKPQLEMSFIQKDFHTMQRLRSVEFSRDYNLESELSDADQTYIKAGITGVYRDSLRSGYEIHYLENKAQYRGVKNDLMLNYTTKKNYADARFSLLNARKEFPDSLGLKPDHSTFLRYHAEARRKLVKSFWAGAVYSGENNRIEDRLNASEGDFLSENSFRWDELRFKAGVGDTARLFVELDYYTRRDDSARLGSLQRMSRSQGWELRSKLIEKKDERLMLSLHWRTVKPEYEKGRDEHYLTGNARWYRNLFRGGMVINVYYELGSGVEPQREFEYVKVTDGTGIYKWVDYNGDGIPQLDEFEIAEFQDEANYIRVYTNTVNYLKTNRNNLNISVRIKPKELLNSKSKFLDRWMFSGSLQSSNAALKEDKAVSWNPFEKSDDLLARLRNVRATLQFNRGSAYKWSAAYTFNLQESQNYLFTGMEGRDSRSHLINAKYSPFTNFFVLGEVEREEISSRSQMFLSKRFRIEGWKLNPKISYQIENKFSATLLYTWQKKDNMTGEESLLQSTLGTEVQWNDGAKSSLLGTFNYVKNDFTGDGMSVVGNQMMEGLKAGNNLVWQLMFQRQLNSFLSINLIYDGRKTEGNKTIQSGNIQLQARF